MTKLIDLYGAEYQRLKKEADKRAELAVEETVKFLTDNLEKNLKSEYSYLAVRVMRFSGKTELLNQAVKPTIFKGELNGHLKTRECNMITISSDDSILDSESSARRNKRNNVYGLDSVIDALSLSGEFVAIINRLIEEGLTIGVWNSTDGPCLIVKIKY